MEFLDYYATLGVGRSASAKEIKQAYRKLARQHHPDVNPGDAAAERRFKEINEAYEVLGDADKRRKYDELGANWKHYEQAQRAGAGAGPGFESGGPFQGAWSDGPGGYRTMTEEEVRSMFGDADPFSDFFRTFFGGATRETGRRTRGRTGRARAGRDVEHEIELTLEQVFGGVTQRFTIEHDGANRTVDVRIPAGVGSGSRVRVAGEGERGGSGGRHGDLYLRVRVAPHPVFERRGTDLHTRVSVPVTTAVLGGEAAVPTLSGTPVRLRIPGSTQAGQVFRLKGHGMPMAGKSTERGDLYAAVDVKVPRTVTAEEREHYEALRRIEDARKVGDGDRGSAE